MPFRRRPQRRAFSSSRFRKRGLRQQQDLRRWEYGNFDVLRAQTTGPGVYTANTTALAQVGDHLADNSSIAGNLAAYNIRAIEIGGIVFSLNSFLNQQPQASISAHTLVYYALFVDRLSQSNAPVSLPAFGTTQTPILAATQPQPQEVANPTRVLWREQRVFPTGAFDLGLPHPQTYYSGSRSLRLRLRLVDEYGLFFHVAIISPGGAAAQQWTTAFNGGLYWRAAYK